MRTSGAVLTLLLATWGTSAAEPDDSDSYFPIWGDEARARGYSIPLPYGVNLSYMNIRQDIMVDSITFSGLKLGNHPIPSDMFAIDAGHTREKSKTENLRLDMWVFPFLNVYGLVGHTRGSSVSQVSVDSYPSQFRGLDRVIAGAVHQLYQSGKLQDIDFTLDFKGTTWGAGFTLAGGYGNWFGLVDTNYTRTDFDILDGSISAVTVSPRVGYRFSFQGIDGPSHLSLWVGSMYQDVQQEFKGDLADLHMPPELQPLIAAVNKDGEGKFDVKQKLTSPWNMLIGAQYEVTKNFNVLTEFGFNDRNSFFVSGEYRF
ncbi:hypothetical protein SAMN03159356_00794 [Klebsiella quasipneumoniae]|uniref:hypothetical protein n=1 Tax=Klebsiella quasipneumoniae TaxID=1463165 RepID=UPI0008774B85|nr:hypothetical protein [Klebsiella quasipneumoniae]SCW41643.1 hypothetical protein SAMN03159441_00796 [Klebsiella quasipneumoniae]SCX96718.1 hypothetical protein SAMN03159308_00419 [Klebsiella quasipneumoniae]SCZ52919.1 hypothetical protein SAMN03159356_00794 [Klebsiella quasipneumoniae]SDB29581.1 hypothetical protein SAMN03159325_1557 [Klebsiella quasipneumoniae]SDZ96447.1 hypothetical protein SAMN03159374_1460 [Klebsiella quasipneumoniae]